jgi:hypothetical protein
VIGTKSYAYNFFRHFQKILIENPNLPKNLPMNDEGQFHLPGTVNEQKFRYSSVANPHEIPQSPLYDSNLTVWCAVWSRGDIGPYLFEDEEVQAFTVSSQYYTEMISEFLISKLPPNHNLWYQQDCATVHTAVISKAELRLYFRSG